ncbi:MAG: hypothetical protein NT141_00245 [candidate division WWE3 bacterium]|nr:hypothetical protein [candidate division WWE3 bacterium]
MIKTVSFITTLITGSTIVDRVTKARALTAEILADQNPKYDLFVIDSHKIMDEDDKKSVGIARSRELIDFLKTKPFSHSAKVGLILETHFLTPEALNSLLKTLEEPPSNSYLILTADKKTSLLPTIISRCHLVNLGDRIPKEQTETTNITAMLKAKGDWVDWVNEHKEELTDRAKMADYMAGWEGELRGALLKDDTSKKTVISALEKLWVAKSLILTTNVSVRLAVEEFVLSL